MTVPKKYRSDRKARPLCRCGCGQEVRRPHNSWAPGHRQYPKELPEMRGRPSPRRLPRALCACGCGEACKRPGRRFVGHHWGRVNGAELSRCAAGKFGAASPSFRGGRVQCGPYVALLTDPDNPRRRRGVATGIYEYEHRVIARRAHGGTLPPGVVVFGVHTKAPRLPGNIVMGDEAYKHIIQRRARAFDATGHPDWRWCCICKTWDRPEHLHERVSRGCHSTYHPACARWRVACRTHRIICRPGSAFYAAALEWDRQMAQEHAAAADRRRIRAGGKCGGTKQLRKSDARGGATQRFTVRLHHHA